MRQKMQEGEKMCKKSSETRMIIYYSPLARS